MIEQGLFKRHFVGRDGFHWWIGQVVQEGAWVPNIPGKKSSPDDHKGFEHRYKVRIMGYHTADSTKLKDDDLPWATVMYPVTAGAGSAGVSCSPNLRQGNFVYGFFLDGEDAQMPIIMGVIGYNQYTSITKNIPPVPFMPFSGASPRDFIPKATIKSKPADPPGKQTNSPGKTKTPDKNTSHSVVEQDHTNKNPADEYAKDKGKEKTPLAQTEDCEKIPLGRIQKRIQKLIQEIQNAKKAVKYYEDAIKNPITINGKRVSIEEFIQGKLAAATTEIAGGIKWLITQIQKYTINKINDTLKDTYYLLFPNDRPKLKKGIETVNDLLACLFRKIIGGLLKMVGNFLLNAFDKFVNAPLCAAESLIGNILGQVTGLINNVIDKILGPISDIVGAISGLAGDILGFITDLLSFLSCDENPSCPKTKEWSIWDGPSGGFSFNVDNIINTAKNVASTVKTSVNNASDFDFGNVDFAGAVSSAIDSCGVAPLLCGPPSVSFFGGGGSGAAGNAIISSAGSILGVDITVGGSNYGGAGGSPFVDIQDSCGSGSGSAARATIGKVTRNITNPDGSVTQVVEDGIVDVVIEDPGAGYLAAPNGNKGGDGRTFSKYGETIIKRADGSYDIPYKAGEEIILKAGDEVQTCDNPPYIVSSDQTIVAPECPNYNSRPTQNPSSGSSLNNQSGNYTVVLQIKRIEILEPGFGYSEGDTITITPDNGALLRPVFNSSGTLDKVEVLNGGIGFTEFPDIYINSDTGYNARLVPVFDFIKVSDVEQIDEEILKAVSQNKVISVVDCVGKV